MNAKQVDAAGFLMRITSHAATACTSLAEQMVEPEVAALLELRDRTIAEVNTMLEQFAKRRENEEAHKLAAEQAAAEEAAQKAAAKQKELEELKAASEKATAEKAKAEESAEQAQKEIDALKAAPAEETEPADQPSDKPTEAPAT